MREEFLQDQEIVDFLKTVFIETSKKHGFEIVACEILSDHVHVLINQKYNLSPSFVMKNLKGVSSRRLFQKINANRFVARKLWGRSFYSRRIPTKAEKSIVKYINEQKNHDNIDRRYIWVPENSFSGIPNKEPRIYSQVQLEESKC